MARRVLALALLMGALGASDNCGVDSPLDWKPLPPTAAVPITCGMSRVWFCNLDKSAAAVPAPYPTLPCGVLLCGPDIAAALATAARALHGAPADFPDLQCFDAGLALLDRSKISAAVAAWNHVCLKPEPEPCKGVGELCDGAGECCEPLLCDPAAPRDVDEPYVCCADPNTYGPCKVTSDCCLGRCEGGACMCSDLGGPCATLWDCCGAQVCAGGICACIATGDACDENAPRVECCDGYCLGGLCTPG